ncbi:MAG: hypothetical protein QOK16_3016 [Solirubrobacteraceae bacterium]|nr:hypothetical protein [Solirubrobacteraceae bacterium]
MDKWTTPVERSAIIARVTDRASTLAGGAGRRPVGERAPESAAASSPAGERASAAPRPDRWLLAFAASVFVFHQAPALAGEPAGDVIDLFTPLFVAATSAGLLLSLGAPRRAVVLGLLAALLYVHGQGVHLAANSIHNEGPVGSVEKVAYFWDERFSHIEALLGWLGLLGAFCLGESASAVAELRRDVLVGAAALLGWTFFTSTVEGQTWPLQIAAAAFFVGWALRARRADGAPRPLLSACAAAMAISVLLIGVWALSQGGVPEFSDTGII